MANEIHLALLLQSVTYWNRWRENNSYEKMNVEDYKNHSVEKISELRISDEGQEGINAFLEKIL